MRRGPTSGAVYDLSGDVVTVGRGSKNTIVIHDNEVSREHCRLVRVVDDYEDEDLNSSNGTFVNGQRVIRNWLLQPGFLVELGDSITLEYERTEAPAKIEPPESDTEEVPKREAQTRKHSVLMMVTGPDNGRVYTLVKPMLTVGRDLSNDIIIQDPEVSRFHLRVRRTDQGFEVEDTGSTNGTMLNNAPLQGVIVLKPDDMLRLGTSVQLHFMTGADVTVEDTASVQVPARESSGLNETSSLLRNLQSRRATTMLGAGMQPANLRDHIFIAYTREDWERYIATLAVSLQDAGLPIWVDQYLTQDSPEWRAAVDQALYECWLMIVVMTPRSLTSTHVKASYRYFMNREKPIIPLVYEPTVTMPVELAKKHMLIHDRRDPTRSLQKLISEIKGLRTQYRP